MTVTVEQSLPVLIHTHEPFIIFSLLCPLEEGSDREVWMASGPTKMMDVAFMALLQYDLALFHWVSPELGSDLEETAGILCLDLLAMLFLIQLRMLISVKKFQFTMATFLNFCNR